VLVVTGWKLVSLEHVRHLFARYGLLPAMIWAATFVMVVATDLLTGVLVGMALTLLELIPHLRRMRLRIDERGGRAGERDDAWKARRRSSSCRRSPRRWTPCRTAAVVRLDTRGLSCLDHTVAEALSDWLKRQGADRDARSS
jgi:MFS superfamily sulfate permease-like transporter